MRALPILVVLLTLAASAQENPRPATALKPHFRISGTVVNAISGEAVSEVEVAIGKNEGSDSVQTMITAEDGRFHFENLAQGKYWLAAQGKGFPPQRFDEHENYSTAIAVGPNVQSEDLVFRLRPDATITGSVIDEQNEPVRNAQVILFRAGVQEGTTATRVADRGQTDDRGVYRLGHQRPGIYYVAVVAQPWYAQPRLSAQGETFRFANSSVASDQAAEQFNVAYPATYYSGSTDPSGATPIVVKPGDVAVADFALSPVPALRLRITGLATSQGFGASLTQSTMGGLEIPVNGQITTSGNHEIEIDGVPPGQFDLTLQSWGKTPSSRQDHVDLTQDLQTDVSSTSAAPTISGVVRLDTGKALPQRAFVQLLHRGSGQNFTSQVSEKGEFEMSSQGVRPGTYDVLVFGVQNGVIRELLASGAKISGEQIEVGPSASVQLTITLSQGVGRVDGTALRDGKPFSEAMVVLIPEDIEHNSTLVRRDQSDSDGTFSLYNVLPGKYRVIALANGWDLHWMDPGVLQPYLGGGESIEVAARGRYNLEVNVQ